LERAQEVLRAKKGPRKEPLCKGGGFRTAVFEPTKETAAAHKSPLNLPDFIITSKMAVNIASANLSPPMRELVLHFSTGGRSRRSLR